MFVRCVACGKNISHRAPKCPFCGTGNRVQHSTGAPVIPGAAAGGAGSRPRGGRTVTAFCDHAAVADEAVAEFALAGVSLDFSAASAATLDVLLSDRFGVGGMSPHTEQWRPDEEQRRMIALVGSYIGEVIRARHGGSWTDDPAHVGKPLFVQLDLGDFGVIWPLDRAYRRLKDGERESLEAYVAVIDGELGASRDPRQDAGPWTSQSAAFLRLGRLDVAYRMVDRALALAPEAAEAWLCRAQVHERAGRASEAQYAYEQAHRFDQSGDDNVRGYIQSRIAALDARANDRGGGQSFAAAAVPWTTAAFPAVERDSTLTVGREDERIIEPALLEMAETGSRPAADGPELPTADDAPDAGGAPTRAAAADPLARAPLDVVQAGGVPAQLAPLEPLEPPLEPPLDPQPLDAVDLIVRQTASEPTVAELTPGESWPETRSQGPPPPPSSADDRPTMPDVELRELAQLARASAAGPTPPAPSEQTRPIRPVVDDELAVTTAGPRADGALPDIDVQELLSAANNVATGPLGVDADAHGLASDALQLAARGRFDEALVCFAKALESAAPPDDARLGFAMASLTQGQPDDALEVLAPLVARRDRRAVLLYARALAATSNHSGALAALDTLAPAERASAEVLHARANALLALGRAAEALDAFAQLLQLDLHNPPAWRGMAHAASASGDAKRARIALAAYIGLEHPIHAEAISSARRELGKLAPG